MKVLTFGSLFPDATRPSHGVFVEQRLRHLIAEGGIDSKVVAPVPWFPSSHPRFGDWAAYAAVPAREMRDGIEVLHPRWLSIPKIGMTVAPSLMAMGARSTLARILAEGWDFDVIDAQYFFPDGVAAVSLGRRFKKPVVITARGTDLNLIPEHPVARGMIRAAAMEAKACITVCAALKDVLIDMGVPDHHVHVLRNGVDPIRFAPPDDRDALRREFGWARPTVVCVGHLIPRKGPDLVLRAVAALDDVALCFVGDGPEEGNLRRLASELGISDRVSFAGRQPPESVRRWFGAADLSVLASDREGWANVLLESMACGTPVVATRIWGTPEVVAAPEAGVLVDRTPASLADGMRRLLASPPSRLATRAYAETFDWGDTARRLKAVLTDAARR